MEKIEVTGKTVEEALINAALQLETSSDNLEYEVIEKGSNGLFGFINSKPAKILVSKKQEENAEIIEEITVEETEEVKPEKVVNKGKIYPCYRHNNVPGKSGICLITLNYIGYKRFCKTSFKQVVNFFL